MPLSYPGRPVAAQQNRVKLWRLSLALSLSSALDLTSVGASWTRRRTALRAQVASPSMCNVFQVQPSLEQLAGLIWHVGCRMQDSGCVRREAGVGSQVQNTRVRPSVMHSYP